MGGPHYDPAFPGGRTAFDMLTLEQQEQIRERIAMQQASSIPQAPTMSPFGAPLITPPPSVPLPPQPLQGPTQEPTSFGGFGGIPTGMLPPMTAPAPAPVPSQPTDPALSLAGFDPSQVAPPSFVAPPAQAPAAPPPLPSGPGVPGVGVSVPKGLETAIRGTATAEASEAEKLGKAYDNQVAAMDAAAVKRAKREIARDEALQAQEKEVTRTMGVLSSFQENPWQDKSTGHKVAAAIAVGLGAIAQSIQGGRNNALDIINEAIDGDIAAQKTRAEGAQNTFRMLRDKFGDERLAEAGTRQMELERAESMIKAQLARGAGPIALAKGEELIQKLRAEAAAESAKIRAQLMAKAIEAEGKSGLSKEGEEHARQIDAEYGGLKEQADELLRIAETRWAGQEAITAESQWTMFKNALIKSFMGNATKEEVARMDAAVKRGPNVIRTEAFKAQLRGIIQAAKLQTTGKLRAYGKTPTDITSVPTLRLK